MSGWHVITAGPSAGKSSVIRELSARGNRAAPEGARIFIDQKVSEGYEAASIREEFAFTEEVEKVDKKIERRLPRYETVYLDRALADNIAYRRHQGMDVPREMWLECSGRYDVVFLLERITYEDDYARDESEQEAERIHELLEEAYRDLGYTVHEVPLMPVDERADYIESVVQNV